MLKFVKMYPHLPHFWYTTIHFEPILAVYGLCFAQQWVYSFFKKVSNLNGGFTTLFVRSYFFRENHVFRVLPAVLGRGGNTSTFGQTDFVFAARPHGASNCVLSTTKTTPRNALKKSKLKSDVDAGPYKFRYPNSWDRKYEANHA